MDSPLEGDHRGKKRKRQDDTEDESLNGSIEKKHKKDKHHKKDKKDKKRYSHLNDEEDGLEPAFKKHKPAYASKAMNDDEAANVLQSSSSIVSNGRKAPASSQGRLSVEEFRRKSVIAIDNDDSVYDPILDFTELDFDEKLMHAVRNFEKPTPIQSQCWPIILQKKDIIGIAETGSGKTLAFVLPILFHVYGNTHQRHPTVLILSPTRELATQTADTCIDAGQKAGIRTLCTYGGVSKYDQQVALKGGIDIVVATPGRLMDLMNDKSIKLSQVKFLVLDEADRMLDMGFEKDIRYIAEKIPADRQTLMFSATWPAIVRKIAEAYLKSPIKVTIGSLDLSANKKVTQIVEVVEDKEKDAKLRSLLGKYHNGKNKVLVFVLYKKEAGRVEEMLRNRGFNVQGIHADKGQQQRTLALEAFKSGKCPLLVATDVAARGLDVPEVEYVINYTFPLKIEDYIHRIGRTGRAGKTGIAHTFFTVHDKTHSGELIQVLKEAKQEVPPELMKFGTGVRVKEPKATFVNLGERSDNHIVFDSDSD